MNTLIDGGARRKKRKEKKPVQIHGTMTLQLEKDLSQAVAYRKIRARKYPFKLRGYNYDPRTGKGNAYG